MHTVYKTVTVTAGAPASTSTGGAGNDVGGFKYAGCFKDASGRALNGKVRPDIGRMSNEKCVAECKKLGFSAAGTEYGGQCYCGNELEGSERLDESACNMPARTTPRPSAVVAGPCPSTAGMVRLA